MRDRLVLRATRGVADIGAELRKLREAAFVKFDGVEHRVRARRPLRLDQDKIVSGRVEAPTYRRRGHGGFAGTALAGNETPNPA